MSTTIIYPETDVTELSINCHYTSRQHSLVQSERSTICLSTVSMLVTSIINMEDVNEPAINSHYASQQQFIYPETDVNKSAINSHNTSQQQSLMKRMLLKQPSTVTILVINNNKSRGCHRTSYQQSLY